MENASWIWDVVGASTATLATIAIPVLLGFFWKWLEGNGIKVEERHRAALHSALETAARAWAMKNRAVGAGIGAPVAPKPSPTEVTDIALEARKSTPDAFRKLDPPAKVIENLVLSKIQKIGKELL